MRAAPLLDFLRAAGECGGTFLAAWPCGLASEGGISSDRSGTVCWNFACSTTWGKAITGDVPCFEKEAIHEREEERAVKRLAEILPEEKGREFLERLSEFEKGEDA